MTQIRLGDKFANDLRSLAKCLSILADTFDGAASEPEPTAEEAGQNSPSPSIPPKPSVTLEEVRAALAEKSRSGHTAEVRELLIKHGASKLSDIDPAKYSALLTAAAELGGVEVADE